MAPSFLRKIFLVMKLARGRPPYIAKGRETIRYYKYSKVSAIRKWRLGHKPLSPEVFCLKFSQAEGNFKACLVTANNINIIILPGEKSFIAMPIFKRNLRVFQ